MLPKAHRVTRRRDFARVNAAGKSVYTARLRLRWVPTTRAASRFAVVVSTRVSKQATKRNRLKRQLRDILRQRTKDVVPGYDAVISASAAALGADYNDLAADVLTLLRKAGLAPRSYA